MIKLLTVAEAAQYLRTSKQQVRRLIQLGDLSAIKVGREYRISLERLAEFLEV
jgi:DNA binding domain, excisionase family